MTEAPQHFGPGETLVGVLSLPAEMPADPGVGFLLFNAGVIPRVGPHRMNVRIARALAAAGHVALRFDLAGHGDSPPALGGDPMTQGTRDLIAAMDHLQATVGVRRFAVIGVCSGAVNAYHASIVDSRVTAVLMFDGYWYRSRWTTWVRDLKRLRAASAGRIWRQLLGRIRPREPARVTAPGGDTQIFSDSGNPPRAEFSLALSRLVERRAAVLFVYSGSVLNYYSYGAQFRHVFGTESWFPAVQCQFHSDMDHSFLESTSQRRFVQLVLDWLPAVRVAGPKA